MPMITRRGFFGAFTGLVLVGPLARRLPVHTGTVTDAFIGELVPAFDGFPVWDDCGTIRSPYLGITRAVIHQRKLMARVYISQEALDEMLDDLDP